MGKQVSTKSARVVAVALSGLAGLAHADSPFSEREQRWINAAIPVLAYAQRQGLPVDVVVQPQPAPGLAPVAMAHLDGRCKLVFSMRGNPAADTTEASIPAPLFQPVVEAVVAHEMAHCWRRVQGAWNTVPAGFSDAVVVESDDPDLLARWRAMRETRREEGYADLVGLAWTAGQHPDQYRAVHDWFTRERADPPLRGSHHDTRAWVRLSSSGRFGHGATPFEQALPVWLAGLATDD